MKFYFLLIQLFLFNVFLTGQTTDTELLIRWEGKQRVATGGVVVEKLVPALNIELVRYPTAAAREKAITELTQAREVWAVERNQLVNFRADPNDPEYAAEQANLLRVGYDKAWDLTPGGRTMDGQEIVVAILDAGFDTRHRDLRDNLWINTADAFGDGIDNDGNGYVDDVHGWDMVNDRFTYPTDAHGTQVIGILGAKGNNGRGVAGTNWDIKMMLLSINSIADIVEAYGYILEQRQRYNLSGGTEGAFVVATNASFGVEGGTCADFPVWGSMYEALGQAGVLTAASTANRSWDVDRFGDMPTDCTTDFIIGVANLGTTDRLHTSSGFGRESIDLAAPGEGSYSTRPNSTYGSFASTSA
ncbi:MAG: S8 family serine peptidase, partial [Bacteroidota bacterium]